jgi:hypothetical protein
VVIRPIGAKAMSKLFFLVAALAVFTPFVVATLSQASQMFV